MINDSLRVVDEFSIRFELRVRGKSRPKFDGRSGRCYMPKAYVNNKEVIRWVLRQAVSFRAGKDPFLSAQHGYVQNIVSLRKRRNPKSKKEVPELEASRPYGGWCFGSSLSADLDNFIGTIMDAAQGVLYVNDNQVVKSSEERVWSDVWGADYTIQKVELHEWLK